MTEAQIKSKANIILSDCGYVFWYPPKVKFYERDIFGIFDLVAVKDNVVHFIQLTTISHLSHRRRKIKEFFAKHSVKIPHSYVWAYAPMDGDFIVERVE